MSDARVGDEPGRLSDEELLAATPRGTGGREARVGVFVLLGIISTIIVLFWMTDPATLRGRYMLVTTVDNAGGIRAGDPIQMHGVILGRVHRFEMREAGRVDITMEIDGRWEIPVGSRTVMGASGLFGGRTLEIVPSESMDVYAPWDTMTGEGAASEGLLGSVDALSAQAGSVLASIDELLNEETVGSVKGSAEALEELLTQLSAITTEQRGALQELTETLNGAAEGLETATSAAPDIVSAVARVDSTMVRLAETSENIDAAATSLRTVLDRIERGEGTLGRLSTDDQLYVTLMTAAESVTALVDDLQANPRKYISLSIF